MLWLLGSEGSLDKASGNRVTGHWTRSLAQDYPVLVTTELWARVGVD